MGLLAVSAVQWAGWGAVLAAVFTGGTWLVTYLAHRQERTRLGIRRKVHINICNRFQLQPDEGLECPEEWEESKIRCFGFDLLNVGPFPLFASVHVENLRVGRKHLPAIAFINVNDKDGITLDSLAPEQVWVAVYNENGWKSEKPFRSFARWRVHATTNRRHSLTRRVWLQPLGWPGGF